MRYIYKQKKCKQCKQLFEPKKVLQSCCGLKCAIDYSMKKSGQMTLKRKQEDRKIIIEAKKKMLTHSDWIQILQKVFNTFIRLRDKDLPCISCGTTNAVEYAAGHFYPTTYTFLRFNEDNVHKQCNKHCNMMLRGNLHEYKVGLIKKIGLTQFYEIESMRHCAYKISIEQIKEKIIYYKKQIKELK